MALPAAFPYRDTRKLVRARANPSPLARQGEKSVSEESNVRFTEREALFYHSTMRPGKIEIVASKPMATQRDLSLAYSPGVAVPVQAIADNPATAYEYTAKGNLVAVISNGTAILEWAIWRWPPSR
jgi:malic enzyme